MTALTCSTENPDCGGIASLAAVAYAAPGWITSHITVIDGTTTNASSVRVEVYDYHQEPYNTSLEQTADWSVTSVTSKYDDVTANTGDYCTDIW